ncbi:MAG: hypothetical protein ACYTEU_05685 [Planctomycetota bacterium]|jgi:hypothetical protein
MSTLTVTAANRSSGRLKRESPFRHRKRFPLTTRFRREKVRVIRQQLAEGIYDLDEHLNAVVDSLHAVLTGPKMVSTDHSPI